MGTNGTWWESNGVIPVPELSAMVLDYGATAPWPSPFTLPRQCNSQPLDPSLEASAREIAGEGPHFCEPRAAGRGQTVTQPGSVRNENLLEE